MNILIAGGTGFVGKKLTSSLLKLSYHVYILTRTPQQYEDSDRKSYISYDDPVENLPNIQAVINLAGDSLYGYWTKQKKKRIKTSRMYTTQKLISYMEKMKNKPNVFINSSAVGFYGTSNELIFTEQTTEPGDDFLANVVVTWEKTAKQAEELGIRTVYTRFGVVLGNEGGALPVMKIPVNFFAGGRIGNGEQWISWVHIQDAVDLIILCIKNEEIAGPINVTAPKPERNKDFMRILAKTLDRPYWFPTPSILMRLTIGEMSELITKGQYVLPQKAQSHHFNHSFANLADALQNINHSQADKKMS